MPDLDNDQNPLIDEEEVERTRSTPNPAGEKSKDDDDAGGEGDKPKVDPKPDDNPEDKPKTYRFSQFNAQDDSEYLTKLEEAYANTSAEGDRISKNLKDKEQQLIKLIAENPELAKKMKDEGTPTGGDEPKPKDENPYLKSIETEHEQKAVAEFEEFAKHNPEVKSDPALNQKIKAAVNRYSNMVYEEEGRLATMTEALEFAYNRYGLTIKGADDMADKGKTTVSTPKANSTTGKGSNTTPEFDENQRWVAQKLGIDVEKLKKYQKSQRK